MASEGTNNSWPLVQLLAVLHQIDNKGPLKIAIWHEMEMSGLLGADRGAKCSPALYTCARVSTNVRAFIDEIVCWPCNFLITAYNGGSFRSNSGESVVCDHKPAAKYNAASRL